MYLTSLPVTRWNSKINHSTLCTYIFVTKLSQNNTTPPKPLPTATGTAVLEGEKWTLHLFMDQTSVVNSYN